MRQYVRGQAKTLTIRSADIINNVVQLATIHKDPDEEGPNPHRIARKLLREASNALLYHKDLYNQLMNTITHMEEQSKERIA